MTDAPLSSESQRLRTAATTGTKWLEHLQLWRPEDVDTVATGAHETAVILLRGTFDLMAGTTSWPARGARQRGEAVCGATTMMDDVVLLDC